MNSIRWVFFFMMIGHILTAQEFITVREGRFFRGDQVYCFLGANYWYGLSLGRENPAGQRARLLAELDQLRDLGVSNLRIMAASEGPDTAPWRMSPALQSAPGQYREELFDGLDFLLAAMKERGMTAVLCLGNFWHWSGGFGQYLEWADGSPIPYPPPAEGGSWPKYMLFASRFYKSPQAIAAYHAHVRAVVGRTNRYTGRSYRDDPTIMAWELANEPRGMLRPRAYRRWIRQTAKMIRALDPHHLITIGSEGNTALPTGNHFRKDHRCREIDYTTVHIWVQNWQWYDPQQPESGYDQALDKAQKYLSRHLDLAQKLRKPLVLEEFGIARDGGDPDPLAPTAWRDRFFTDIFRMVLERAAGGGSMAGCNFWAWGGQGRPRKAGDFWQPGDEYTGDPPHEPQGWYSVYDNDTSTLELIREFAGKFNALNIP